MSRTIDMAELLIYWWTNLPDDALVHPELCKDAVNSILELDAFGAINHIVIAHPCALAVKLGKHSYLGVTTDYRGTWLVCEFNHRPVDIARGLKEQWTSKDTVYLGSPLDAMINLKQRYEWSRTNG